MKIHDQLMMKLDSFINDWDHKKKLTVVHALRTCLQTGGIVIGVYQQMELIAFANEESNRLGTRKEYVELRFPRITRKRIGKRLF